MQQWICSWFSTYLADITCCQHFEWLWSKFQLCIVVTNMIQDVCHGHHQRYSPSLNIGVFICETVCHDKCCHVFVQRQGVCGCTAVKTNGKNWDCRYRMSCRSAGVWLSCKNVLHLCKVREMWSKGLLVCGYQYYCVTEFKSCIEI